MEYEITGKIVIEIGTSMKGKEREVALLRRKELESWLKRHCKDIEAIVCSHYDTIEDISVEISEREE